MIRSTRTTVKRQNPKEEEEDANIREITVAGPMALIRRGRQWKADRTCAFSATLKDINKALQIKARVDPQKLLPPQYHNFLDTFN